MAENIDYDEISDKKISEIKDLAEEKDLDLKKLLKAEKDNKDRKTLKEWINDHIESEDEVKAVKDKAEKDKKETKSKADKARRKRQRNRQKKAAKNKGSRATPFLIGLIVGGILVWLILFGMGSPGSTASEGDISPSEVRDGVNSFLQDRIPASQANFSLGEVDSSELADFYVVSLELETARGSQSRDVYVSKTSGLIFLSPPIDLETGQPYGQPDAPQTGTQQPPQGSQ